MIDIEISTSAGFCFGVVNAINQAEQYLSKSRPLHSLGEIVHNSQEVDRLSQKGLQAINYDQLRQLPGGEKVLFRAHGEAPWVYDLAKEKDIHIIDATCPVVLQLQKRIRRTYERTRADKAQIVIFGKKGHAEVNGLVGQTNGEAIVIENTAEALALLDFSKPIYLFSQTTKSSRDYTELIEVIQAHLAPGITFKHYDTICRQVANRIPELIDFARSKDWIYFIAGKNSSNGKVLFDTAQKANPHTTFISSPDEITAPLPDWVRTVGISGATSTPTWLMEDVARKIRELNP